MKEITPFSAALRPSASIQGTGRGSRRNYNDVASIKSFEGSLATSKMGLSQRSAVQSGTVAGKTPARPTSNASILAAIGVQARQNSAIDGAGRTPTPPVRDSGQPLPPGPTPNLKFNSLQQNWLDSNTGNYAALMVHNLSRSEPFVMESVGIQWANGSTGKPEFTNRAVGNVSPEGGKKLAQLLGGSLVDSPLDTFGTTKRDQYIRMPNGQMIEASVLASQLNAARTSQDPFSATQSVIDLYRSEAKSFNLQTSMDAIDLVTKGVLIANRPVGVPS